MNQSPNKTSAAHQPSRTTATQAAKKTPGRASLAASALVLVTTTAVSLSHDDLLARQARYPAANKRTPRFDVEQPSVQAP